MSYWEDEEAKWSNKLKVEKEQTKLTKTMFRVILLCLLLICVGILYNAASR